MSTAYPNADGRLPSGPQPFTSLTYTQQMVTGAELYFPQEGLRGEYKGLSISKNPEHQLFYIVPQQGKVLPSSLSGNYTKLGL
jgi:hypothetical protein